MRIFRISTCFPYKEYPIVQGTFQDLRIDHDIPNMSSISSSLDNYTVLEGIRLLPMHEFEVDGKGYSVSMNRGIDSLAREIERSKTIKPLIVVIDEEGPYILEGIHRVNALFNLGYQYFPALLVIDKTEEEQK